MDKVSVIIPVYNNSNFIRECIDSVINQTYKNLEILIIDDNSTDNSRDIIDSYKDKRIKKIYFKKNKGAGLARNEGIKKSTGNYICFIDSDDYWVLDKIEKQLKFIKDNNYTFIYSNYIYYKEGKTHIAKVPKELNYTQAIKNTAIFTSTVMLNMNVLKKEDIYMPELKIGQDAATWWQILKKGIVAHGMNEELSIYRVGNLSLSHNKLRALKRTWNLIKRENLNIFTRIYYFTCYAINATIRRIF